MHHKRRFHGSHHHSKRQKHSADGRWGPTRRINMATTDKNAPVRRTYCTNGVLSLANTNGTPFAGRGFSLVFEYDTANNTVLAEIYQGAPQQAVGTATTLNFENLQDEFQHFMNIFRYFKLTKFQVGIARLPMAVYTPSQASPNVPSTGDQQQGAVWSNMGDPGVMIVRPWAGTPGNASYADGTLTGQDYTDHARYKEKMIFRMDDRKSNRPKTYCVKPVQPILIDESAGDLAVTSSTIKYQPTPAIDMSNFKVINSLQANSYGMIVFWYFPDCINASSGFLSTDLWFEIEVEYFGLENPAAFVPPAAEGTVYSDSKEALAAVLSGVNPDVVDKPPKPAPKRVPVAPPIDQGERKLDSALKDMEIVDKPVVAAAAAKVQVNQQSNVPPTRPNTPTSKPPLVKTGYFSR